MNYFRTSDYNKGKNILKKILKAEGEKEKYELNIYDFMRNAVDSHRDELSDKIHGAYQEINGHIRNKTIADSGEFIAEYIQKTAELLIPYFMASNNPELSEEQKMVYLNETHAIAKVKSLEFTKRLESKFDEKGKVDSVRNIIKERANGIIKIAASPAYLFVYGLKGDEDNKIQLHFTDGNFSRSCVGKNIVDDDVNDEMYNIAFEDNSVPILEGGKVYATNMLIKNFDTNTLVKKIQKKLTKEQLKENDRKKEQEILGFMRYDPPVGARHLTGITISHHIPYASVYTLSEQTGCITRFKNGQITFSMVREEMKNYLSFLNIEINN